MKAEHVVVSECTFRNTVSKEDGGAITAQSASVKDSSFYNCQAHSDGKLFFSK